MTRRLAVYALALAAVVALAVVSTGAAPGKDVEEIDAIFDNASFLIPGQDVKIGGARVGSVKDVTLTRDRRARVTMEIESGFAPFRRNAECSIRPQSLIGEKFVQCEPGSSEQPELAKRGARPTVPVERTHSPVDLDLVFGALRRPVRERLTILLNELGTGLAGRPEELNDAIRRANPALQQAKRTLEILSGERQTLGRLIDESDRVIAELADRRGEVRSFISNAADVTEAVADRRDDLDLTVRRLPPLLDELEPSARELAGLAAEARPQVRELGEAAPAVRRLLADFDPLADATRPTLVKVSELARTGRRAVRAAGPVADELRPVADRLPGIVPLVRELTDSIAKQDVVELVGRYAYFAASAASRFDRFSHILPSYQVTGTCAIWTEIPRGECDAHHGGYQGPRGTPTVPEGQTGPPRSRSSAGRRGGGGASRRSSAGRRPGASSGTGQSRAPAPAGPGASSGTEQSSVPTQLLDFLLAP
jgi:phospholipid/cholesterol/gamma-HCH transport system substrate-binding protein